MGPERCAIVSSGLLLALLLPSGALAQQDRLGAEFQVNTQTLGDQTRSAVAASASGSFVVAWQGETDGENYGVFARRFSSTGAPDGAAFLVNTHTADVQAYPSVAMDGDGDFVVVWSSTDGHDGAGYGVFAQRFSSAGVALATEFQVNTYTLGYQERPSVAAASSGDFVVAWSSNPQDGASYGIFARRFSSLGAAIAVEFQVNTRTDDNQSRPSVAAASSGGFVVVWHSFEQDGSYLGVFARPFSSTGAALATEFQVNSYTGDSQRYPSVAAEADGDFLVAWQADAQDGSSTGIFARLFSSAGAALATEFQVNSFTDAGQREPTAAAAGAGGYIVAWQSDSQDGSSQGIFARRSSSSGALLASEFRANRYTQGSQSEAAVTALAGDEFLAVWTSSAQDGDVLGVFGQRFGTGPPLPELDVDGSGGPPDALTDGLLVLRHLFGFTNATLATGAIDLDDCTRCDGPAVTTYLNGLGLTLDIDDSGAPLDPLTDGLLVLRFLFGFNGSTLTNGAVDVDDCTRCDAATIAPYLATLTS